MPKCLPASLPARPIACRSSSSPWIFLSRFLTGAPTPPSILDEVLNLGAVYLTGPESPLRVDKTLKVRFAPPGAGGRRGDADAAAAKQTILQLSR